MPEALLTITHGMTIGDLKKYLAAFPADATIAISNQISVEDNDGPNCVTVKVVIH